MTGKCAIYFTGAKFNVDTKEQLLATELEMADDKKALIQDERVVLGQLQECIPAMTNFLKAATQLFQMMTQNMANDGTN